jgi:hypothetical protein
MAEAEFLLEFLIVALEHFPLGLIRKGIPESADI